MRYFILSASLFVTLLFVVQFVHAQSPADSGVYNLVEYKKDFKTGYTVSSGLAEIRGQVFRPIADSTLYEGYPEVELTLDAGADFSQQVVTDEKGFFTFADVPVGSFTIFAQNTETNAFGSVTVILSREFNSTSSLSGFSTDFDVDTLKLLFTDEELFILGQAQEDEPLDKPLEVEAVSQMATGCCSASGFGGDMGMFGAALGIGALATGIAALASNGGSHGHGGNGHKGGDHWHPKPVTVGAGDRPDFRPGGGRPDSRRDFD